MNQEHPRGHRKRASVTIKGPETKQEQARTDRREHCLCTDSLGARGKQGEREREREREREEGGGHQAGGQMLAPWRRAARLQQARKGQRDRHNNCKGKSHERNARKKADPDTQAFKSIGQHGDTTSALGHVYAEKAGAWILSSLDRS